MNLCPIAATTATFHINRLIICVLRGGSMVAEEVILVALERFFA